MAELLKLQAASKVHDPPVMFWPKILSRSSSPVIGWFAPTAGPADSALPEEQQPKKYCSIWSKKQLGIDDEEVFTYEDKKLAQDLFGLREPLDL